MTKTRRRIHDRPATHFAPYFDFGETEESPSLVPSTLPTVNPLERILKACEDWTAQGNQIVHGMFGVRAVDFLRDEKGFLSATYEASGEMADPLGILLIGQPCIFMPILSAARILEVSEFWVVGFIHGFDRMSVATIGKNLEKLMDSDTYLAGRRAGQTVAAKYIKERVKQEAA